MSAPPPGQPRPGLRAAAAAAPPGGARAPVRAAARGRSVTPAFDGCENDAWTVAWNAVESRQLRRWAREWGARP